MTSSNVTRRHSQQQFSQHLVKQSKTFLLNVNFFFCALKELKPEMKPEMLKAQFLEYIKKGFAVDRKFSRRRTETGLN